MLGTDRLPLEDVFEQAAVGDEHTTGRAVIRENSRRLPVEPADEPELELALCVQADGPRAGGVVVHEPAPHVAGEAELARQPEELLRAEGRVAALQARFEPPLERGRLRYGAGAQVQIDPFGIGRPGANVNRFPGGFPPMIAVP